MLKKIIFRVLLALSNEHQRPAVYRRFVGVKIGARTRITGLVSFGSEPYLVEVGDHVTLAHNVTFLTHDGGSWVIRDEHPHINIFDRVVISDNVFVGNGVTFLPGVKVGSNSIIGAGSVVSRSIPANSVAAGNPARVITSLEGYRVKMLQRGFNIDSYEPNERRRQILDAVAKREQQASATEGRK